jgi:hypothetical protein
MSLSPCSHHHNRIDNLDLFFDGVTFWRLRLGFLNISTTKLFFLSKMVVNDLRRIFLAPVSFLSLKDHGWNRKQKKPCQHWRSTRTVEFEVPLPLSSSVLLTGTKFCTLSWQDGGYFIEQTRLIYCPKNTRPAKHGFHLNAHSQIGTTSSLPLCVFAYLH